MRLSDRLRRLESNIGVGTRMSLAEIDDAQRGYEERLRQHGIPDPDAPAEVARWRCIVERTAAPSIQRVFASAEPQDFNL